GPVGQRLVDHRPPAGNLGRGQGPHREQRDAECVLERLHHGWLRSVDQRAIPLHPVPGRPVDLCDFADARVPGHHGSVRRVSAPPMAPLSVAIVGAGYCGPNLIRNFLACPATDLRWVCDLDLARARKVVGERTAVTITDRLDDLLDDPHLEAVAIATPA